MLCDDNGVVSGGWRIKLMKLEVGSGMLGARCTYSKMDDAGQKSRKMQVAIKHGSRDKGYSVQSH